MTDDADEREPDYRMSFAAERTYLAYLRTGLALVAAGVATAVALPDAGADVFRRCVGLVLIGLGAGVLAFARPRWAAVERAMRRGEPLPRARLAAYLGPALVAVAIGAGVLVIVQINR